MILFPIQMCDSQGTTLCGLAFLMGKISLLLNTEEFEPKNPRLFYKLVSAYDKSKNILTLTYDFH